MKLRRLALCVSIFTDWWNQSIHYYRLHSDDIDWFPIMIDFHRLGTPGQEAYDQYDHLVPQMTKLCEDQHPPPALPPPPLLSKCRLPQLSINSCYKNAPQRGSQHVIRLNLLLTVHGNGDFVAYIFRPLRTSEIYLEGTMEQDRRLNNVRPTYACQKVDRERSRYS